MKGTVSRCSGPAPTRINACVNSIGANLWWVPLLPLLAAGVTAFAKQSQRSLAAGLAIGSMALSFFIAGAALIETLAHPGPRLVRNFEWFSLGETTVRLGWVLDPLTAAMLVMITLVGALIFIFSTGY